MDFELDLTNDTYDTMDAGRAPAGWYRCVLEDVTESKNGGEQFEWAVSQGPYKGSKLKSWVNDPEGAQNEKSAKAAMSKMKLYAKRLGLVKEEDMGKRKTICFTDAIGVEVFLKCEEVTKPDEDGRMVKRTEVEFDGLYALDDLRVPSDVRSGKTNNPTPAAIPPAGKKPKASAPKQTVPPVDEFDDV